MATKKGGKSAAKAPVQQKDEVSEDQQRRDEAAARFRRHERAEVHDSAGDVQIDAKDQHIVLTIDGSEAHLDKDQAIRLRKKLDEAFQVVA